MTYVFTELFRELAIWTTHHCQPFEPTFVAHLLTTTRYEGFLTTVLIYAASFRYCDIYLFFFGVGTTVNGLLNVLLRVLVHDERRASPLCFDVYNTSGNWPSYQTQDSTFIVVFLCTYAVLYRARVDPIAVALLLICYAGIVAGDLLLNYHTGSQVAGAVGAGTLCALAWQFVIRFALLPYVPWLLRLPVVAYFEYTDAMIAMPGVPKLE
jgi:membrane-associated phospholipid phosphatase